MAYTIKGKVVNKPTSDVKASRDFKENTIQLRPETIQHLKYFYNRQYDDDTYDEIITTLINFYEKYGPALR